MKQRTLTLVKAIHAHRVEKVREELRERGDEVQAGNDDRFKNVEGLHFIACCILPAATRKKKKHPAMLVVEVSFDGRKRPFLKRVVKERRKRLDEILDGVVGYPPADAKNHKVVRFLSRGLRPSAVYVGTPGRGLGQIEDETGLHADLYAELDRSTDLALSRAERWSRAVAAVYAQKEKEKLQTVPRRPWRVRFSLANRGFWRWLAGGVYRAAIGALAVVGVLAALRWPQEPLQWLVVLGAPLAIGVAAAVTFLAHSPRRLTLRGRLPVLWSALRELFSTAIVVVAIVGVAIAARDAEIDWSVVASISLRALGALVSLAIVAGALVFGFTVGGKYAAWIAGLATATLLVALGRLHPPRQFLGEVSAAAALGALLVAGLAAWYLWRLRRLEAEREVWDEDVPLKHLEDVKRREFQQLQSHLAAEAWIADEPMRMATLRAVLRWIDLLARYVYNQGRLDRITTIHFARWLVLPDRRSLVFLSNYDDRFEDYLGDFSGVSGVTAIWGNTAGFPRPFLLAFDGARNESVFKRYARNSQVESLVWYSAYPNLTVAEIDEATILREQMARPIDDDSSGYLAGIRRWWRRPLDELSLVKLIDGH